MRLLPQGFKLHGFMRLKSDSGSRGKLLQVRCKFRRETAIHRDKKGRGGIKAGGMA